MYLLQIFEITVFANSALSLYNACNLDFRLTVLTYN